MMKADPVRDETRTTHNYFAHGGNELVIGGKLTFLPTATVVQALRSPPIFPPATPLRLRR